MTLIPYKFAYPDWKFISAVSGSIKAITELFLSYMAISDHASNGHQRIIDSHALTDKSDSTFFDETVFQDSHLFLWNETFHSSISCDNSAEINTFSFSSKIFVILISGTKYETVITFSVLFPNWSIQTDLNTSTSLPVWNIHSTFTVSSCRVVYFSSIIFPFFDTFIYESATLSFQFIFNV